MAQDERSKHERGAFAAAALIGLLAGRDTAQFDVNTWKAKICNDAFVLGEEMMRVDEERPLP